jgi:small subunit ribosomal protein S17
MSENENQTTEEQTPESAAERPVRDSGPGEGVSGEPGGSPGDEARAAGEEAATETPAGEGTTPEAPAAEPAPEATAASAEQAPAEPEASETAAAQESERPKSRKRLPRSQRHKHSKPKRERPTDRKPITRLPKPESTRGRRQERRGVVVSSTMDKTIVVKVDTIKSHPRYKKVVRRSLKFHAHDPENKANVGDIVRIVETRPISKTKNWRLAEIVEAAR